MGFYCLCLQPGLDRFFQQLFGTGFPDALSPPSHARRIYGNLMLEELHPAEKLPVRILHPTLNDIFIAEVDVLQVVKRNHQSCTDSRLPGVGTIARTEKLIQSIPFNHIGQLDQFMARVDDAVELNP
jgi:hypothetical protein